MGRPRPTESTEYSAMNESMMDGAFLVLAFFASPTHIKRFDVEVAKIEIDGV